MAVKSTGQEGEGAWPLVSHLGGRLLSIGSGVITEVPLEWCGEGDTRLAAEGTKAADVQKGMRQQLLKLGCEEQETAGYPLRRPKLLPRSSVAPPAHPCHTGQAVTVGFRLYM